MSYAVASESIFQDRRLSGADVRLLLAILSHTRPNKPYCWPSRARLAECVGIKSHSRISEVLGRLVDYGWLSIKRTGRSSLYTVHTPDTTSDVHPVVDMEETSEYLEDIPLTPCAIGVTVTLIPAQVKLCNTSLDDDTEVDPIVIGEPIGLDPDPETSLPTDMAKEEDPQGERAAPTAPITPSEPPTGPQAPAPAPKALRAAQSRSERLQRIAAAKRIVERLNQVSGSALPTDSTGIAVRRAARALTRFTEQEVIQTIIVHALGFHHPASILKGSVLEPLIAQQRAAQQDAQKRLEADQKRLEAIKASNRPQGNKDIGRAALAALKARLGPSKRPLTDTLRA